VYFSIRYRAAQAAIAPAKMMYWVCIGSPFFGWPSGLSRLSLPQF
jgi:hypothetical protein